ncbi:MAG: prepilin-type N-terminal cleavage/methylation domain-containing protein [Myxococcales bacterium]|nr:prepilin-type N-terminal cleavage/methylation domain-containing protein [Myxococcales bacterium]
MTLLRHLLALARAARAQRLLALVRAARAQRPSKARSRVRRRRAARRLGYTVVEVMMALSVLSIGATGVIAMQKTALLGNMRARNLATATAIASAWIERLRVDGLRWTFDPLTGVDTLTTATTYLNVVGGDYPTVAGAEGQWRRPIDNPGDTALTLTTADADVRGMDIAAGTPPGFCTNIRLTQILPNMIRAEVRVFWLRQQAANASMGGTFNGLPLCDTSQSYIDAVTTDPTARQRYHFVFMTSTVLRNDQQ